MNLLSEPITKFFHNQNFVILATIDANGCVHTACKGIIEITKEDEVYLLDLYRAKTFANLKLNSRVSITAVDEHKFKGFCLKGTARIATTQEIDEHFIKAWEDRITSRLTQRVLRNIQEQKGHPSHPEALLPKPQYVIIVKVEEVVDLTPHHLK
jgi:predicted pyridoxine 5'-phosphate oxidase superfamily flavin-nucleotide-binding protein